VVFVSIDATRVTLLRPTFANMVGDDTSWAQMVDLFALERP
jgi:hypothetical protein